MGAPPAVAAAPAPAAAAAAPAGYDDDDGGSPSSSTREEAKRNNRSAAPADAPAGEEQDTAAANPVATLAAAAALAQAVASCSAAPADSVSTANGLRGIIPASSGNSSGNSTGVKHVKISTAQPATFTYEAPTAGAGGSSSTQPVRDAKALLLQLFANFPTACLDMIQTTEASTILEGPVLTRAARQMPACMGRRSVVILGEAAHPVRPSGECLDQVVCHIRCKSWRICAVCVHRPVGEQTQCWHVVWSARMPLHGSAPL